MAQSKYIQSLKKEVGGRNLSTEWYRRKIIEFGKPNRTKLIQDGKRRASPFFGKLNMFFMTQNSNKNYHTMIYSL